MRRAIVLGLIVTASVVAAAWGTVNAQQPAPAPAAGRGQAAGVGMIQKVKDNLYMIPGAGGNTVAFVAANGIVLVDTKLANNGQAILDQVKSVSDKPITHIINTHTHGDHNGSNQFFPATVEIVAQENTDANMKKMPVFQEAANKHGLPDRTYKDQLTRAERQRRHRPVLLRRGAHQRRHVRAFPQRARAPRGRRVREQGTAEHRPPQRRQRRGLSGHDWQGGVHDQERGHGGRRPQREPDDRAGRERLRGVHAPDAEPRPHVAEGRQDAGAGHDGVPGVDPREVQGLQPGRRPRRPRRRIRAAVRRAEDGA